MLAGCRRDGREPGGIGWRRRDEREVPVLGGSRGGWEGGAVLRGLRRDGREVPVLGEPGGSGAQQRWEGAGAAGAEPVLRRPLVAAGRSGRAAAGAPAAPAAPQRLRARSQRQMLLMGKEKGSTSLLS